MIVGQSRRAWSRQIAMLGVLAAASCAPIDPPASQPTRPTVVGQPAPSEQRDVRPFLTFPCNLLPPAVVDDFSLREIRPAPPDPASPGDVAHCKVQIARVDPAAAEDDVTIAPYERDVVAEEEARRTGLTAAPPVVGLPAGVRSSGDDCSVYVRTAPDQGLLVDLVRYDPAPPEAGSPCDVVLRIAGSLLAFVPRSG
ncbi:DUF3558 family protein [Actinomycetospora succinea]|uniref:DUF3558 family protein n=1 Tax=Actinomycetospora succinea TaxID=663603 RepID=UPI0014150323|nr:DUF3558 family protein [Actinomycetospora succinea]